MAESRRKGPWFYEVDGNPCELRIHPGDPVGGIGPTVEYYCP